MKKFLLSASALLMAASSFAAAQTDGQTYATVDGMTCENLWVLDRVHGGFEASTLADKSVRTATTDGKTIYVGKSLDGTIQKFDVKTGEYLGQIQVKKNGEAYVTTLGVNQVGFDEYGHFYVATFSANSAGTGNYEVFLCNLETGELTSVGELGFLGGVGRVDYCDVIGDLTGEKAGCTVAAACSSNINIFMWHRAQGADTWEGGWNGLPYQEVVGTFPKDQTNFSYGSVLKLVRDGSASGELGMFYVDGFTTFPALYGSDGSLMDSFENVDYTTTDKEGNVTHEGKTVCPSAGTNGVAEANIGTNLIVYSEGQYDAPHKCQAIVTSVDESLAFSSMKALWTVPADGMGNTSDSGTRVHCLDRVMLPDDAAGKKAMLLVSFKCFNGLSVYKIAQEGYNAEGGVAENVVAVATINVNGDVIAVSEVAESIEIFNIAGQKVASVENAAEIAAPANGAFIVKAVVNGNVVVKKVIL